MERGTPRFILLFQRLPQRHLLVADVKLRLERRNLGDKGGDFHHVHRIACGNLVVALVLEPVEAFLISFANTSVEIPKK
jgi:hypothetical protein